MGSKDDRYIFAREDETPLRLAYPNDKLTEIIRTHKLHSITVHGLRHTHASLLFEAGASIKKVQERLGHSDIKMTMNIYTHVTKSAKEKTANRFEKFMETDEQITGSDVVTSGHRANSQGKIKAPDHEGQGLKSLDIQGILTFRELWSATCCF
ncbi:tyrosine-type recombinase/integrase [Paenibacillus sp. IHBB 3054]|uniref:tyrosine-type recombinase/integrase n=1 Tax=Paenibacillus sp. IHBB 3054 TaxID=3425689 RepID=UPI003F67AF39